MQIAQQQNKLETCFKNWHPQELSSISWKIWGGRLLGQGRILRRIRYSCNVFIKDQDNITP